MAKEYIERETVLEILRKKSPGAYRGIPCYPDEISASFREVNKLPAADVVEVVHAKWEYHGGDDDNELYGFCTNCHHGNMTEDDIERLKPRYCPNCGARMDGE